MPVCAWSSFHTYIAAVVFISSCSDAAGASIPTVSTAVLTAYNKGFMNHPENPNVSMDRAGRT